MNSIKYLVNHRLADTVTPVSLFLKLRDQFSPCLLLESSDYHGNENAISFICCEPLYQFSAYPNGLVKSSGPGSITISRPVPKTQVFSSLSDWIELFEMESESTGRDVFPDYPGCFGYMNFDTAEMVEDIEFTSPNLHPDLPIVHYQFFRYLVRIDHFRNEMTLYVCFKPNEVVDNNLMARFEQILLAQGFQNFQFSTRADEESLVSDTDFLSIIEQGRKHCLRGDVFQVVLSRRFSQAFEGDEFNVYRALRSINPSAYLFFFDYGDYRLFGSSPEAQLVVANGKAEIHPIAGTFRRTGNDTEDAALAVKLANDPKENAEHVMLVDLARNDLSRNCEVVKVETFAEVQYYSHVIHLVSKVAGLIGEGTNALKLAADTFPAGTLSGAPKYEAMRIIDTLEPHRRGFYGGCIGILGFDNRFNHAIIIRSFFSKDGKLHFQAGAGVVANSVAESELMEVTNKLAALRKAIQMAQNIF